MPKSHLTWYISKTKEVMRAIRGLKQKDIADTICESPQVISYRLKNVYEKELEDFILILDLAGYEIKKKEEEEWVKQIKDMLKFQHGNMNHL